MEKLTPEEILKNINDNHIERGTLKVFLGYAAGVGKTFHMLDLAHDEYKKGANIIIGYIQKHARKKTLDMMRGMPRIENKIMDYKGKKIEEFNLEKALEIKPDCILIDELAHTNVKGSKNEKRYQDVEELLKNGIDVYTTLNVQHIDRVAKYVEETMEIPIKETIPAQWFDRANKIEFIDVPPEELIQRIEEGKIYRKENAKKAVENFFTLENLQLLREIAFRYMVNTVDKMNVSYTFKERILFVLNVSKKSEQIIREIDEEQIINNDNVFIIQLQSDKENDENQIKLMKNAGITYVSIEESDMFSTIREVLEQTNISRIIFLKEIFSRRLFFPYLVIRKFPEQSILFR